MSQPNVVPRVNSMVQSMERPYIDLTASQQIPGAALKYKITHCTEIYNISLSLTNVDGKSD